MVKRNLKRTILSYLLFVLGIEVSAYILLYPLYMSGSISRFEFQSSFYIAALFMPFLLGWAFFFVPYVLIKKCEKCGSKNMRFAVSEGFVCDDCNHVFTPNLQKNAKMLILSGSIPVLFFGPFALLGTVLAGEQPDSVIVFFSMLLSFWLPSFFALLMGLMKLMDKSVFFNEHNVLGLTLLFVSIIILGILMLISYGMIIKLLLTGTI